MKKLAGAAVLGLLFILPSATISAQDKGQYIEPKNEFYEKILAGSASFQNQDKPEPKKAFKVDFSKMDLPKSLDQFKYYWHNQQLSQGNTGTCWDFAGTSYFESEIFRISGKKIKLSEMFTDYWEYVDKATYYVEHRGTSHFGEGSELNAVVRVYKKYGCVPEEAFTGLQTGQKFHDHAKMFKEMNDYLQSVKTNNAWDEAAVINTIKSILNHYIGVPPETVTVDGKSYTPKEYLEKVTKLKLDDYVNITSLLQKPYYQMVEYKEEDNWWHSADYYNVTLPEYMDALKKAVRDGYTIGIAGDVSEPGLDSHAKVAIVPSFDIPSQYIDEYAREFRISNKSTTDDHAIHLVGYMTKDNKDWYLIKDSGSGSKNVEPKGYYFFNEDYVKLKIVNYIIHKDAVKNLLEKFDKK